MSPEQSASETEKEMAANPSESVEVLISKQAFRTKVWESLTKNRLVNFPRPVFGRIPNFKGATEASARLLDLDEFKSAKSVEVNPDKTLESCRMLAIENNKVLYVPIPRLQDGLLKKLSFCEEDKPKNLKQAVKRWGIENSGENVDYQDNGIHIDLLVLGSVAVSKEGRRIGKGKGYADLEYAILREMKAVDDSTVIVTIVHDSQIFDTLPSDIFEKFDVPLDYILTPTQTIKIEKKLERPQGIYWNLLSQRRVNLMPILQKMKQLHESQGRETALNPVDTDVENEEKRKERRQKRFIKRKPKQDKENGDVENENNETSTANNNNNSEKHPTARRKRFFRRSNNNKALKERQVDNEVVQDPKKDTAKKQRGKPSGRFVRRLQVDFSVYVSNIDKNVRVRHLKNALIDNGIKPNNITWRGYKGFCYLHYAKPSMKKDKLEQKDEQQQQEQKEQSDNNKEIEAQKPKDKSFAVDNVIEILQTLKLSPESTSNLNVKIVEPITRIETTDVTAV